MPPSKPEGYLHKGTVEDLNKIDLEIAALSASLGFLEVDERRKAEELIRKLKEQRWGLMVEMESQIEENHRN